MLAMGAGLVAAGGAAGAYMIRGTRQGGEAVDDEEPEMLDVPTRTWKESAGRTGGRDGYVFGDLSRGVAVRYFGKSGATDDTAAEEEGDAQHTQVQKLVREAVALFRARGYCGSINMGHTVAYFNESVSVRVDGPGAGDALPWEKTTVDDESTDDTIAAAVSEAAIALALDEASGKESEPSSVTQISKSGQAGYVFATLLARLERRAKSWEVLSGDEKLDPSLTQSAQVGFAIPIVKLGWGVSVSLTVSASSLLRWAKYEATLAQAQ